MSKLILDDIRFFVEIAKTGSFKRASESLGIPPATLSRRIADLENRVGLRLINRTTRKLSLTSDGEAYVERCQHLIESVLSAHEDIALSGRKATGTLRISCTPDFAAFYLPPVLKTYTAACPAVNVDLSINSRIEDLQANNLDASIRIGPLTDSTLVARPLGTLQHVLCASQRYLNNHKPVLKPLDLTRLDCIRLSSAPRSASWDLHHPREGVQSIPVKGRIIAGSPQVAYRLVMQDMGVALLDPLMASAQLASKELVTILPEWRPRSVPLNVMTPSRLMPARLSIFIEHLQAFLNQGEWFNDDPATMALASISED